MKHSELIDLTLDQLTDLLSHNPERFTYARPFSGNTNRGNFHSITWQARIDINGKIVDDPNCDKRTVIVAYSSYESLIRVYIFSATMGDMHSFDSARADAVVEYKRRFFYFTKHYKKFFKIARSIEKYEANKEVNFFLKKLSSVFPSILDKHIFD